MFWGALRVACRKPKISSEGKWSSAAELKGRFEKNGTFVPYLEYCFSLGLREGKELQAGEIDNAKQVLSMGKLFNVIVRDKGCHLRIGDTTLVSGDKQEELVDKLRADPELLSTCMDALVQLGCESIYGGGAAPEVEAEDWVEEEEL